MIESKCEIHKWKLISQSSLGRESQYQCELCHVILSASEVFQLENMQLAIKWQKENDIINNKERKIQGGRHWQNLLATWVLAISTIVFSAMSFIQANRIVIAEHNPLITLSYQQSDNTILIRNVGEKTIKLGALVVDDGDYSTSTMITPETMLLAKGEVFTFYKHNLAEIIEGRIRDNQGEIIEIPFIIFCKNDLDDEYVAKGIFSIFLDKKTTASRIEDIQKIKWQSFNSNDYFYKLKDNGK